MREPSGKADGLTALGAPDGDARPARARGCPCQTDGQAMRAAGGLPHGSPERGSMLASRRCDAAPDTRPHFVVVGRDRSRHCGTAAQATSGLRDEREAI